MRVIKSIKTTDAILTSSNIPEDEYPAWVSAASYTALNKVIYNHKIYEAILTHTGKTTTPDLDQLNWLDLGATNRYRMFDNIISNIVEFLISLLCIKEFLSFLKLKTHKCYTDFIENNGH